MEEKFVKFVYRLNDQILYANIEDIIDLEYNHKKFLWDIPKETLLKTYKKSEQGFEYYEKISIENLKMTLQISNKYVTFEYLEKQ